MPGWDAAAAGVDISVPNIARMYDYMLGGKEHFAADRAAVQSLIRLNPVCVRASRESRAFLGRAVTAAARAGVRQFLEIGAGLPTGRHVHEIARQAAPGSRVIYVDYDPVVIVHTRALLDGQDGVWIIERDVRRPAELLAEPVVRNVIDFGEPIGIMLVGILNFIPDESEPWRIVATLAGAAAPGSYVAITHGTAQWHPHHQRQIRQAEKLYRSASSPWIPRTTTDIAAWLEGMNVLAPGIVPVGAWRPDDPASAIDAKDTGTMAAVAVTR